MIRIILLVIFAILVHSWDSQREADFRCTEAQLQQIKSYTPDVVVHFQFPKECQHIKERKYHANNLATVSSKQTSRDN